MSQVEDANAAAGMSRVKSYSMTVSLMMGVGTSVVGLVPVPWVFLVGVLLIGILVVAAVHYRKWRWTPIGTGQADSAGLAVGCVTASTLALLLRGSEWSYFLVPALSVGVTAGLYYWLTVHGRLLESEGFGAHED